MSQPSNVLDKIYALENPPFLTFDTVTLGSSSEELLLNKDKFASISKEFDDPEIAVLGNRALAQLTKQLDGEVEKRYEEGRQQREADAARTKGKDGTSVNGSKIRDEKKGQ